MSANLTSPGGDDDDARRLIAEAPIASRTDIINLLVRCFGFQRYLEIGLGDPAWNFARVVAPDRQSVDPFSVATFRVPSDEFFRSGLGHERYDLVFIDGMHEFEQCLRDIENALARLSPAGFVVVHDVNPPTEWHQRPPHEAGHGDWNGTVWKSIVTFRRRHPEIWLRTVDVDWGCAVLHAARGAGEPAQAAALPDVDALTWSGLEQNRVAWLSLISVDDFRRALFARADLSQAHDE
jgi:hypothetical protein